MAHREPESEETMQALHLGYHYIRDGSAPGATCSPSRLRAQIRALKDVGFVFMTCREVTGQLLSGGLLRQKHVTLSFDDGLKDQVTTALPILVEEKVRATFFVISSALEFQWPPVIAFQMAIDRLGVERLEREILPALLDEIGAWSYRRLLEPNGLAAHGMKMGEPPAMRLIKAVFNHFIPVSLQAELVRKLIGRYPEVGAEAKHHDRWFMNQRDIQMLRDAGMEIASHTVNHPWLNMIGEGEIEAEAHASRSALEGVVGYPPTTLAWTFGGAVRPEAQAAVARAGYQSAWNFWSAWDIERFQKEYPYRNLMDIPRLHEQAFNPA